VRDTAFGQLLRTLRLRAGLSQNRAALLARVDPAYVNRLERGTLTTASRRVVLHLADALDASEQDRERLLVAAGHCPEVILACGGWDGYLERISLALMTTVAVPPAGRSVNEPWGADSPRLDLQMEEERRNAQHRRSLPPG
jgi:transcriptional regulator with XRE-family HTH domain